MRFNPPPGWPPAPAGFSPGPGWRPDPRWPPVPPGWQLWVPDDPMPGDQDYYYAGGRQAPNYAEFGQTQAQPQTGRHRQPAVTGWDPQISPAPAETNGMATAAFVLGLLGISAILGIVFGIIALRRIRATLQRGRGLAIAGIVLGSLWVAAAVAVGASIAILGTSAPTTPSTSRSTPSSSSRSGQQVNPFSLTAGDCFNNPTVTPGHITDVGSVVQTSCTQPHNAQIFGTFNVTGSSRSYPGSAKLTSIANSGCNARAKASLDSSKITSSMQIRLLFPLQSSWTAGHRQISCIIYSPAATLTTSVLNG